MINSVVLEGFIVDGYEKKTINRDRISLTFTLIVYNEAYENMKSKYNRIECLAIGKIADFFLDNAKKIIKNKVAIIGSLKSRPDGNLYVKVSEIGLQQGEITLVNARRIAVNTKDEPEDISTTDERVPY